MSFDLDINQPTYKTSRSDGFLPSPWKWMIKLHEGTNDDFINDSIESIYEAEGGGRFRLQKEHDNPESDTLLPFQIEHKEVNQRYLESLEGLNEDQVVDRSPLFTQEGYSFDEFLVYLKTGKHYYRRFTGNDIRRARGNFWQALLFEGDEPRMYVRYENRSIRTLTGVPVNNFCHGLDLIMCPDSTGSLSWIYSDKYVDFVYESVKASGYDGYMYIRGGSGNTTSWKKTRMNTSKSNERFRIEKTEQSVSESLGWREGNHVIWHYLR